MATQLHPWAFGQQEREKEIAGTAASMAFPELVADLSRVLGKKLIAYIGHVGSTDMVEGWINGTDHCSEEARIRLAWEMTSILRNADDPKVIQKWFTGLNPDLADRSAIRVLRDEEPAQAEKMLMNAAHSFAVQG